MNRLSIAGRLALWVAAPIVVAFLAGAHTQNSSHDTAEEVAATIRPEAIRADMRFLAGDLLEGRAPGTRGYELAAKFMASEFEAMGLEPAGENGTYFQSVPLRSIRPDEEHSTLTIAQNGEEHALASRRDFIISGDPGRAHTAVEAPVVYVGYGVTAPELGYDDYAGVDTRGKIVAYLFGAPPQFEAAIRAHYSISTVKWANAAAHDAVGTIVLDSPAFEQLYPFKNRVRDLSFPEMRWLDAKGQPNDYFPGLRGAATLSMQATARLFEGSGKTAQEIYAAADAGKPSSLVLPMTARIKAVSQLEEIRSPNVVARLRGSDPKLREEYVVYTAHLDHLGVGEPVNGDNIYNGALDNASGAACLLEITRAFSQLTSRPRRSILFVAVTAEEEGLLGSDYFAHYPTVARDRLIADINLDGAALLWPLEDVTAPGAEHSTLGAAVHDAASRLSIAVSPDPHPEQVLFIRSDQYSFVKQGIPSVFPHFGVKSGNPKIKPDKIMTTWLMSTYHKPADDMNQPFDFDAGAKFTRYSFLVGYLVAQQDKKPAWNPGDFFGQRYSKKD